MKDKNCWVTSLHMSKNPDANYCTLRIKAPDRKTFEEAATYYLRENADSALNFSEECCGEYLEWRMVAPGEKVMTSGMQCDYCQQIVSCLSETSSGWYQCEICKDK